MAIDTGMSLLLHRLAITTLALLTATGMYMYATEESCGLCIGSMHGSNRSLCGVKSAVVC